MKTTKPLINIIHSAKGLMVFFWLLAFGAQAGVTITSFTPTSACSGSLGPDTIYGTGFTAGATVKFNGTTAASFTYVSATEIIATPAAGTTTGAITIKVGGSTGTSSTFTVNAVPTASITPAGPSTICGGAGSLALTASGGGTYRWNATGGSATTAGITATASGTYTVTVTSAAGCTATASNVVTVDPTLTGNASATAATYYNGNNGTATMTPSGGTGAYSYSWNNGSTTQTISTIVAGTYSVTVTDARSCTVTSSATVTQPSSLVSNGDIDPVASNLMTAPVGTYVIAMDNELQTADSGYFNIKAYGLAITMLNNKIPLRWVIKAGKSKDSADFSASATTVFPSYAAASTKSFKAGPFLIFPSDTVNGNIHTIVNTFNAANSTRQVYIYQLTSATTVDVRYTLSQIPKAALLNDGGEAYIHAAYMTDASVPTSNYYTLSSAIYLADSCYNFASEPHNNTPSAAVLDSLRSFVVNSGGNILVQCLTVESYEDSTTGRFQSTLGITRSNTSVSPIVYSHPDLSFQQYEGGFDPMITGGIVKNWSLNTSSTWINNTQIFQSGSGANSGIVGQSQAKLGSGVGHLVFYTGGHDYNYGGTGQNNINGERSYFNAFLTPCAVTSCNFLSFGDDLAISETMSACNLYKSQKDTFTIAITNNGPSSTAASGVTVSDILPSSFTYVSSSTAKGSFNSSTGVWTVGSMNTYESDTLKLIASAASSGAFTNKISITKNTSDYNQTNDTASLSGTIYNCSANAGPDIAYCNDSIFTMAANTPCSGSGTWTVISGTATVVSASSPSTTVYVSLGKTATLTWTNISGCAYSIDTINLYNYTIPVPAITPTGSTSFCPGGSVTLTASGGGTYSWSTGVTTTAITASPASTTTYTVTVTNASGCTATASQVVTVKALPSPTITPTGSTTFCNGGSVILTASGGSSYSWSNSASTAAITVNPSSTTTYTVTVTNASGCTATASQVVTVNALPSPTITPTGSTTFCNGGSVILTASGGSSYSWSNSASTAAITVNPSSTTTYTVTVTNASGCTATASQVVTVDSLPNPYISPSSATTICQGTSMTLAASGGTSYVWSTAATTASITVTPASTTTYTVTVTNASGCTATDGKTVTVQNHPYIMTNPVSTSVVTGSTAYFTVYDTGASSAAYQWQVSTDSGRTYTPIHDNSTYSGSNTPTLAVNNATSTLSGNEYEVVITNTCNSLTSTPARLTSVGALPVTWLYFTAYKSDQSVKLNWGTASEADSKDFIVKRSCDGQEWSTVGELPAAGNSVVDQKYSFTDNNPSSGVNYYQISERDVDGKTTYSEISSIDFTINGPVGFTVYPNPIESGQMHLLMDQPGELNLYNSSGELIITSQLPAGSNLIDLSSIAKGMYQAKVSNVLVPFIIK